MNKLPVKMRILLAVALVLATATVSAKVQLPAFFGSGMVLQRDTQCHIWGKADKGKRVSLTTSWDNQTYTARATDGRFDIAVSTPQAGGPYTITISDGETTTLSNVLIGDVWICSGQSNMEMPMKGFKGQPVAGSTDEYLNGTDPQMRLFTVKRNASITPVDDVTGHWGEATPVEIREFSATAYHFGKTLRRSLNIPIGLIVVSWGGSACEAWMTADWLRAFPTVKLPQTQADVDKTKQRCPTALYNGMLHPLIGLAMTGVIWYQGEDNVNRWQNYAQLLTTMVHGWREVWQQGKFPFYYCQIAPYDYSLIDWHYNSANLREQQRMAENLDDQMGMAVLLDAGLEYGIHPRKKHEAGQRLAMLALRNTYGMTLLPDYARLQSLTVRGDTATVAFSHSKEWIYFEHGHPEGLYELKAQDGTWHQAKAWISRNRLYLRSDSVAQPVAARYNYRDYVVADLMHDGLPVSSFSTENLR